MFKVSATSNNPYASAASAAHHAERMNRIPPEAKINPDAFKVDAINSGAHRRDSLSRANREAMNRLHRDIVHGDGPTTKELDLSRRESNKQAQKSIQTQSNVIANAKGFGATPQTFARASRTIASALCAK